MKQCHTGSWEVSLVCLNSSSFSNLNQYENKPRLKGAGLYSLSSLAISQLGIPITLQPLLVSQLRLHAVETPLGPDDPGGSVRLPFYVWPGRHFWNVLSCSRLPGLLHCIGTHTPLPLLLLIMVLAAECGEASQGLWFALLKWLMTALNHGLSGHSCIFLGELDIWILGLFLNCALHLSLSFKSSLYSLDTRRLSDKQFANIFSPPVGCLLTFLIVSFHSQVFNFEIHFYFFPLWFVVLCLFWHILIEHLLNDWLCLWASYWSFLSYNFLTAFDKF